MSRIKNVWDALTGAKAPTIILESESLAIDKIGGQLKADLPVIDAQLAKIDADITEVNAAKERLYTKREKLEEKRALVVKLIEA